MRFPDRSFAARKPAASGAARALGDLPEWNLGDLYAGMDAPALAHDLARAAADCQAFVGVSDLTGVRSPDQ